MSRWQDGKCPKNGFEMFGTECDLIGKTPRCTFDSKQNRIVLNANFPESHFQNCNFRILRLQERLSIETITLGIGPKLQIPQETFLKSMTRVFIQNFF